MQLLWKCGARGSVLGWGTMLQTGRSPVRIPDEVDFFNLPNPSSRTMTLGSTQPLTEMSTRKLPGSKKRPARRAENLAAIYEPNVWNVGASTSRNPKGLHGLYLTLPYLTSESAGSWTVVGLSIAKLNLLYTYTLIPGFSLSSSTYIWIHMVYDYFWLCPV
jgi:hypothetical protein